MMKTSLENLTLKNVTFPQEEFYKTGTFEDLPYAAPGIGTLTIHGEVKNSPLKDAINKALSEISDAERQQIMDEAIKNQPAAN